MKKKSHGFSGLWLIGISAAFGGISVDAGMISGDRVNVRARADLAAEVIGQLDYGTEVVVRGVDGDWVEINPPDAIEFWVHRDFVEGDRVTTRRLNIRAGAGINYSIVGTLERNAVIDRRGGFGEWIKIAPPAEASVFVNVAFVELPVVEAPVALPTPPRLEPILPQPPVLQPLPPYDPAQDSRVALPPAGRDTVAAPASDMRLVPLSGQGAVVQREGVLARTPLLMRSGTSNYRLIRREGNQITTLSFVRGNTSQLESLLDQTLIVHGREFWVEGARQPVIMVEKIERRVPR
ncbi:MAG TPA: SH3 domain-containing protein [Kiritimatiellia bacterium]|nr:SH3 domain-containing protein [Kiritimatiellia bacterium]